MTSQLPIAQCDLDPSALATQLERYQRLAVSVVGFERQPSRLVVRFGPDVDPALVDETLAVERSCCPFFQLEFEASERCLEIRVGRTDQDPALDALALRLHPTGGVNHSEADPVSVEILYFDGCPNHESLVPHLHELLRDAGVADSVVQRRIEDDDAAQRERFLGSPTVRVNGRDVEPGADARTDFGLKCRLYQSPAGLRGSPLDEWLLNALSHSRA